MRAILTLSLLALSYERAEACACCDAKMSRKPIGWNAAGDTILLDTYDDVACEPHQRYEVWRAGAAAPAGCYDRTSNADKRSTCDPVLADDTRKKKFPHKPAQLAGAKLKVKTASGKDADGDDALRVTVQLGGMQILSEDFTGVSHFVGVTAWPSPKGDRVLLLVSYTERGSGNESVDVRWAALKP